MKYFLDRILLCCLLFQATACNDWLQVKPRTEIESEENFSNEQGYKDALTGAYLLMGTTSLYGREMTYGMVDVMGQYYGGVQSSSNSYYYAHSYDFSASTNVSRINAMWSGVYNVIANVNELIRHIDRAEKSMFTGRNYHLIRGEAYGLRAFLHFDLLRLFGPSYIVGADEVAIPYVTDVTTSVIPLSTVKQTLTRIQEDLIVAESELTVDPVVDDEVRTTDDEGYQRDRTFKFNYYAVKMLQARAYLYAQNYTEAAKAAEVVISQELFTWVPEEELSTLDTDSRNNVASEELVFALYVNALESYYTAYFTGETNGFYLKENDYKLIFEESKYQKTDFRWLYQSQVLSNYYYCTKLKQTTKTGYNRRLPLIRLSEAYYIAAECALKQFSDITTAVGYLNTVRSHRGLNVELASTLTAAEVENEIYKEYLKEFFCEGQLFFYYKRNNWEQIPYYRGSSSNTSKIVPNYVFPLPDDELEYGGRSKNN
nr:RagB/SusD family nutrient uptake outer membrane protein [Odoribacter splanchnicus]